MLQKQTPVFASYHPSDEKVVLAALEMLTADNTWSAAYAEAEVTGVYLPPDPQDPDEYSAATNHIFIAQTPEALTYDPDGNMTSDGKGWHYAWNAENRLTLASNATHAVRYTYTYDHQGRMVSKEISDPTNHYPLTTTRYIWDGWNIITETSITSIQSIPSTNTTHYLWGLDLSGTLQGAGGVGGLLAVTRDDGTFAPTYDANGNVSEYIALTTDHYPLTTSPIVAHFEYDPFGNIAAQSGTLADSFSFRFSTKPWCEITGIVYFEFRPYLPPLGRFMTSDSIGERGGLNLYGFVGNDVENKWDYLGLKIKTKFDIVDIWKYYIYEVEEKPYEHGKPPEDLKFNGDASSGLTFSCSCINENEGEADLACELTMRPVIRFPKGIEEIRQHELNHVKVYEIVWFQAFKQLFMNYAPWGGCCNCAERAAEIQKYGQALFIELSLWDLRNEYGGRGRQQPYTEYGRSSEEGYKVLKKVISAGVIPCKASWNP